MQTDWKRTLRLAAWTWRMGLRGLLISCALATVLEAGLLFWAASQKANAGLNFNGLFLGTFCPLIFAAAYLAGAFCAQRSLAQPGQKSHIGYTLYMMNLPRWQLFLAQVLAGILSLWIVMAWQILLIFVLYLPVHALHLACAQQSLALPVSGAGSFWSVMADNYLLRVLAPVSGKGFLVLALLLIVPAAIVPGVFLHQGFRKFLAVCLMLVAAAVCMAMTAAYVIGLSGDEAQFPLTPLCAVLAGMTVLSTGWSVYSMKHAEAIR